MNTAYDPVIYQDSDVTAFDSETIIKIQKAYDSEIEENTTKYSDLSLLEITQADIDAGAPFRISTADLPVGKITDSDTKFSLYYKHTKVDITSVGARTTVTSDAVNNQIIITNLDSDILVADDILLYYGDPIQTQNEVDSESAVNNPYQHIKRIEGIVTADGKILRPEYLSIATGGDYDRAFINLETIRQEIIDNEVEERVAYIGAEGWELDSDTIKKQLLITDSDVIYPLKDLGYAGDGPEVTAAIADVNNQVASEILKRKAYYAYEVLDNNVKTYGSLRPSEIIDDLVANNTIDSETYDSDSSCVFGEELDFSEMKEYKTALFCIDANRETKSHDSVCSTC